MWLGQIFRMVLCVVHVLNVRTRRNTLPGKSFTPTCFGKVSCPSYNCWTKHGERKVMMEDNKEEEDDDIYPEYSDTATGEAEDEETGEAENEEASDEPANDLRRAIVDAHREAESVNEKRKLKGMLEDHKKKLYPNCEYGNTKLGTTLELLQ
jgi:hypothetical protein